MRIKSVPRCLYHVTTPVNARNILKTGLIGDHNGHWCIYLSEFPTSWVGLHHNSVVLKVIVETLNPNDFTKVDPNLDEFLYWGKPDGNTIRIPPELIEGGHSLIKNNPDECQD